MTVDARLPEDPAGRFGPRESMDCDVVVVGAGPAGLAAAIRIKQLDPGAHLIVLEEGSEPGAHTLSGAVMDPRAIGELLPGWRDLGAPLAAPWTIHRKHPDHLHLRPAAECARIDHPKPDGRLTFDRASSVYLSNASRAEDLPSHVRLRDAGLPLQLNRARFAGPESSYCPAGVCEFIRTDGADRLVVNARNCVHCETCDIEDPSRNITWVAPEGSGGPNYVGM